MQAHQGEGSRHVAEGAIQFGIHELFDGVRIDLFAADGAGRVDDAIHGRVDLDVEDGLDVGILRVFGEQGVVFGAFDFNGHRAQVDPDRFVNGFEDPGAAIHNDFRRRVGPGAQSTRADKGAVGGGLDVGLHDRDEKYRPDQNDCGNAKEDVEPERLHGNLLKCVPDWPPS